MPLKITVNWLVNNIWCYLVIGCFDWIIVIFQEVVVRVYYILKILNTSKNLLFFSSRKITCLVVETWLDILYLSILFLFSSCYLLFYLTKINLSICFYFYRNIRRNVNADFSVETMHRVTIIFFQLRVVKNFMQNC